MSEGVTKEERAALLSEFPEPDHEGKPYLDYAGARAWIMNPLVKVWEHHHSGGARYEISTIMSVDLTREQALAIARGLKPEPRDLKLAQIQVAGIIVNQCRTAHGVNISDEAATDIAAKIVQALPVLGLPVLGREVGK